MTKCITNHYSITAVNIILQVSFIFTFLTLFFFAYVQRVEKEEFESQLNLVVDSIMKDVQIPAKYLTLNNVSGMAGAIEAIKQHTLLSSSDSAVIAKNKEIKLTALKILSIFIGVTILILVGLLLVQVCIPIGYHIQEAMMSILFIGLTEFAFLTFIASKYISADPIAIKTKIAEKVKDWIKQNHKSSIPSSSPSR